MSKDLGGSMHPPADGGPAYPHTAYSGLPVSGLSVRDVIAMEAMKPLLTEYMRVSADTGWQIGWRDHVADNSYKMADAMMKASNV